MNNNVNPNDPVAIAKLMESVDEIAGSNQKVKAVIEDVNDPEKKGRVKVRIAGVHPSSKKDLPTEKLPWTNVQLPTGTGGGLGHSVNFQVGQWVEMSASNPSGTIYKILGNVAAIPTPDKGDKAYGNIAEGKDNKLKGEILPGLSTGDLKRLEDTVFPLVKASLLKKSSSPGGVPPGYQPPQPPQGIFDIVANEVDWSTDPEKFVSKFGAELGHFLDKITVDGQYPTEKLGIDLVRDPGTGLIGGVFGIDEEGEKIYIKYDNKLNNLIIPRMILKEGDPDKIIEIKYKAYQKENPGNYKENIIKIKITYEPITTREIERIRSQIYNTVPAIMSLNDSIPDVHVVEPTDKADKTQYPKSKVWESEDNKISVREDYTDGNVNYSITHLSDPENPNSMSRFDMNPSGGMTMKSSGDMMLLSKGNLQMYIANAVEQIIGGRLTLHAPLIQLKGDIRIEGNMKIMGNIEHEGNNDQKGNHNVTGGDVVADGISLKTHTHTGDSGGVTGPPM